MGQVLYTRAKVIALCEPVIAKIGLLNANESWIYCKSSITKLPWLEWNPGFRNWNPAAEFEPSWAKSKPEFLNMNAGSAVLAQVDVLVYIAVFEPRLLNLNPGFLEDLKDLLLRTSPF